MLLDAGNLLFKRNSIKNGPNQEKLTADAIVQIYQDMGYDAVGVGPLDMAAGLDFIQQSKYKGFPWVSANIVDITGKPIFQQLINKHMGTTEVFITAITPISTNTPEGIVVHPWKETLPDILSRIKTKNGAAFIIVLSTLSDDENRAMGKLFPEISLIISADMHKGNIYPQLLNSSLVTQTAKQGKYQGLLEINFGTERKWGQDSKKKLVDLQNRLGSLNWQLKRLEKKVPLTENKEKHDATITRLNNDKEVFNKKINLLQDTVSRENRGGQLNDQYTSRFIGLGKQLPDDKATTDKLKVLTQAIRQLNLERKAMVKKQRANANTPDKASVGYNVCTACHSAQAFFWQNTQHAAAYTTLSQKKKHLDLECLPCHVTLDFRTTDLNRLSLEDLLSYPDELLSVGCETCHGAGKKHSINPEKFKIVRMPEKRICLTCHTPDHDDNFDYNRKLPQISCPAD